MWSDAIWRFWRECRLAAWNKEECLNTSRAAAVSKTDTRGMVTDTSSSNTTWKDQKVTLLFKLFTIDAKNNCTKKAIQFGNRCLWGSTSTEDSLHKTNLLLVKHDMNPSPHSSSSSVTAFMHCWMSVDCTILGFFGVERRHQYWLY